MTTLKGRKQSPEHIAKRVTARKGFHHSEESKKKIREAQSGVSPMADKKHTDESRKRMSESAQGRIFSLETRKKLSESKKKNHPMKGKKHTIETRIKISNANRGRKESVEGRRKRSEKWKGENNPNWQGGLTSINNNIRASFEMKLWREAVFERDDFTCRFCKEKGGKLHADHIKPFALFPELRFSIDNGRTLCVDCHKTTPTYLNRYAIRLTNLGL